MAPEDGNGPISDDEGSQTSSFAEQLSDLDVEVSSEEEAGGEEVSTGEEHAEKRRDKSDEELFREAVEGLSEEQIRRRGEDSGDEPPRGDDRESDSESESPRESVYDEESGDGRMADELSGIDVEVREQPAESGEENGPRRPDASRRSDQPKRKSPEQQFEEALEGMDATQMRRQKFDLPGGGEREGDASEKSEASRSGGESGEGERSEEEARREIERRRQERKFESAMQDVEPIERSQKFRDRSAPDPEQAFEDEMRTSEPSVGLITPRLPKSGDGLNYVPPLDDVQESMMERFERAERRDGVPELNLRGQTVDEALDALRGFVPGCAKKGEEFARIVHGRGVNSDEDPVLKPAVLRWLEDHGVDEIRGYVPERMFGGDYGSVIVEFRRD